MKHKKLWIILISVVLGLTLIVVGVHFGTKLNTVSVEFRTRLSADETRLAEGVLDKVKEDGEFNYKKSVLFTNTEENVNKIEKANPYIKVTQVIKKFPNKICVYVSERIPKYRIKDSKSEKWLILDADFKVLDNVNDAELSEENFDKKTVEVKYITASAEIGTSLAKEGQQEKLNTILSGVYGETRDYFAVAAIDYDEESDTFKLTMKTSDETFAAGCEAWLVGSSDLKTKASKVTTAYINCEADPNDEVDMSQKVYIICNAYGCHLKNQVNS